MPQSDGRTGDTPTLAQAIDGASERAAAVIRGMPREQAVQAAREWHELTGAALAAVHAEISRRLPENVRSLDLHRHDR